MIFEIMTLYTIHQILFFISTHVNTHLLLNSVFGANDKGLLLRSVPPKTVVTLQSPKRTERDACSPFILWQVVRAESLLVGTDARSIIVTLVILLYVYN